MSKEIAVFSRGSINYGINIPTSDEDYLAFTVPTLEDAILKDIPKNRQKISGNKDVTISDIRQLKHMFKKANFDSVQFLWAQEKAWENEFADIFYNQRPQMLTILKKQLHRLIMSTLGEYHKITSKFNKSTHAVETINKFYVNMFIKLDAIIFIYSHGAMDFLPYHIKGKFGSTPILRNDLTTEEIRDIRLKDTVDEELIQLVQNKVGFIHEEIANDEEIKPLSNEEFEELWAPIDKAIVQAILDYNKVFDFEDESNEN